MSEASQNWKRLKELISRYNSILRQQAADAPDDQEEYLKMLIEAERVENKVGPGMPDLFLKRADGKSTWVELKHEKETAEKSRKAKGWRTHYFPSRINLRKEQIIWHANHTKMGHRSWICLRYGDNFFVWEGSLAKHLASGRMIDRNVCFSAKGDMDFPAFAAYLFDDEDWKMQYRIEA